jgi:hypothetical protein
MKEAQEKRIELTEVTRECFLLVLEFLHTGMECARLTHPRTRARARTSRLMRERTHNTTRIVTRLQVSLRSFRPSTRWRCCASATSTTSRRTCAR